MRHEQKRYIVDRT